MRTIGILILGLVLTILGIVSLSERPNTLPIVQTAAVQAPRLFAPCPIAPRNFPNAQERRA